MTVSHLHLNIRDLPAGIEWFRRFLDVSPDFANERMASIRLEGLALVLDQSQAESAAILALAAESCDAEVERLVERGAVVTEAAVNRPWGVRNAYLAGPGAITLEVEETLAPEEG
jgi:predicted enzyme related to lactoylglutathione lyase